MGLEIGTYISDLVITNPVSSDPKSQGDDHFRLIKSTVKTTFPNISGAVTPTHTELNYVDGVTSAIQPQIDLKAPLASPMLTGVPVAPTAASGNNTTQIATTAFVVATSLNTNLPGQTGNGGKLITTDGITASWTAIIDNAVVMPATGTAFVTTTQTQTLTNKTVTSPIIADSSDTTKKANFILSGVTAGQNRNITVEDKDILLKTPGWVYLSTVTASSSATVDLETTVDSTYDTYVVVIEGAQGNSGVMTMNVRLKNGGSYASSGYLWVRNDLVSGNNVSLSTGASLIEIADVVHNSSPAGADTGLSGIVYLHTPSVTTSRKRINWEIIGFSDDVANDPPELSNGAGYLSTLGSAVTGIRFFAGTGNINVGTFTLFGIRKS